MKPVALIVAPTLSQRVARCLARTGFDLHIVASFEAAMAELIEQPRLLITEIRLAAYNGLHLALRARARGIRSIVIGGPDLLFERDAERFGARYLDVAALDELTPIAQGIAHDAIVSAPEFDGGVQLTATDLLSAHPVPLVHAVERRARFDTGNPIVEDPTSRCRVSVRR